MTENTLLAQFVLFLFGGYDTTTTSVSFTTFLLAKNQNVQDKLRELLQKILEEDGELTYENISDCQYLEAAIKGIAWFSPKMYYESTCFSS